MKFKQNTLVTSIAIGIASNLAYTGNAIAADGEEHFRLEEIVVTARKQSESLQSVPVAVSAFNAETLERAGITQATEIAARVPNFQMNPGNLTSPDLFIRGIGTDIESAASSGSVGVYVDEVYLSRGTGVLGDLFDLERVEVLRGPQGTLYGKNVVGGVVSFITKKPNTEQLEAKVEHTQGTYNEKQSRIYVSGPITDNLAGKVSLGYVDRDGYAKNTITGHDLEDKRSTSLRTALLFTPSDDLEVLFNADYSRQRGNGTFTNYTGYPERLPAASWWSTHRDEPFYHDNPRRGPVGIDGFANADLFGASLKVSYEADTYSLTSITAYRDTELDVLDAGGGWGCSAVEALPDINNFVLESSTGQESIIGDLDDFHGDNACLPAPWEIAPGVPDPFWDGPVGRLDGTGTPFTAKWNIGRLEEAKSFSQEFRIASSGDGPLNWLAGIYYLKEEISRIEEVDFYFPLWWAEGIQHGKTEVESIGTAVFGNVSYDFTDKLEVTGGLRYSRDEKEFYSRLRGGELSPWGPDNPGGSMADTDDTWSKVTGSLTVNYQHTEDLFFYATVATGFKSGGWNGENATDNVNAELSYDSEQATNYEIGAKMDLWDKRLRINAALFHTIYEDLQTQELVRVEGAPSDYVVGNGNEVTADGFELEMILLPMEGLTLNLNYGYLDSRFTDEQIYENFAGIGGIDIDTGATVPVLGVGLKQNGDFDGETTRRSPEHNVNLAATYEWSLGDNGHMYARLDYTYQSEYSMDNEQTPTTEQPSHESYDASIGWLSDTQRWNVKIWGKNLTDETTVSSVSDFEFGVFETYMPPRTAGVTVVWIY